MKQRPFMPALGTPARPEQTGQLPGCENVPLLAGAGANEPVLDEASENGLPPLFCAPGAACPMQFGTTSYVLDMLLKVLV